MTEITWYILIYLCFQVLIVSLLLVRLYKVFKNNKAKRLRKNFRLIKGEDVERKISNRH